MSTPEVFFYSRADVLRLRRVDPAAGGLAGSDRWDARYDLTSGEGARVWIDCLERARSRPLLTGAGATLAYEGPIDDLLIDTLR